MKLILNDIGKISVTDNTGNILMDNITCDFHHGKWEVTEHGDTTVIACESVKLEWKSYAEGLVVRGHFTNMTGKDIASLESLMLVYGEWKSYVEKFVYNALINANGNVTNDMRTAPFTFKPMLGEERDGGDFVLAQDKDGRHFVIGFASYERYFNKIRTNGNGCFTVSVLTEGRPFKQGETITTDWLYIGLCNDFINGAPEFIQLTADFMGVKLSKKEPPTGFCTWYYYLGGITPDEVRNNINFLREHKEDLPVKYIQIDDGWSTNYGDWAENEKFACGMKQMAEEIKEAGFVPGIWVAPNAVSKDSKLWKEHPDWCVHRWDNDEVYEELALDMTNPEVKEYIKALFRKLSYEWGYRYIKVDLVIDRAAPGRHYDYTASCLMNIKETFRLARESVTEDTFILACTSPFAPLAGLCDSMRLSVDIFETWEATRCLFISNLNRYFYHGRYFINDFDPLVVRESHEEDELCRRNLLRNYEEIKCYALAMSAGAGTLMFSDKLSLLTDEKLDILKAMFPVNTKQAIPLDFTEQLIPGKLDFGVRGYTRLVGLINWDNRDMEYTIDDEGGYVFEFWSGKYIGHYDGKLSRVIKPHSCEMLFVTKEASVAVVGVDDCLCPTIEQSYKDGVLTTSFVKKGETMFVVSKKPVVRVTGGEVQLVETKDGEYLYKVAYAGEMKVIIEV